MVVADFFFVPARVRPPAPESEHVDMVFERSEIHDYETAKSVGVPEPAKDEFAGLPQPDPIPNNGTREKIIKNPADLKVKSGILPPPVSGDGAKIVVIIDDMGMDRKRTRAVMDLPGPLTLAFLPYAPGLRDITRDARDLGHELLIHMPMEAMDKGLNEGPLVLRADMMTGSFNMALDQMFGAFDGYVGVNNHMGSKLTQDTDAMNKVMEALAARNLIFVDSKTTPNSIAGESAAAHGLRHAARDVFLDNEDTPEFVWNSLRDLEKIARKRGYAIAIGHPRDSTIAVLKEWLPGLKERGFVLVPVSAVVK